MTASAMETADAAFRQQVKAFLDEKLTPDLRRAGKMMSSIFSDFDSAMIWHRILFEKGWIAPAWPVEFGGAGWTPAQRVIFQEECALAGAPSPLPMGIQMLGPILIRYGSAEQKKTLLPRILSGEDVWCQGYSEPGAGSDLASLRMKAQIDGDAFILNGSKIWTSFAHHSNWIFCLVRTEPDVKPQAGISFILVELDRPGVRVEPIVSLDGEVEQCEVFFDDVRVPRENLVGALNQGWEIAKYLLEHERGGYSYFAAIGKQLNQISELASEYAADGYRAFDDPVFVRELAEAEIDRLALKALEERILDGAVGEDAGVFASLVKVIGSELGQRVDKIALSLLGPDAMPVQNGSLSFGYNGFVRGPDSGANIANRYLNNRASTIYGGTAQIQRNIIAKQLLRL
ncbi:MAG: acyl-CoA dehydrogenase family protein [Parvularculaceae bacterium]